MSDSVLFNKQIGNYEITEQLASHDLVDVYKATSKADKSNVIIKVLKTDQTDKGNVELALQFSEVAHKLRKIQGNGFVKLLEVSKENDYNYVVFEQPVGQGIEFAVLLQQSSQLSLVSKLDIALQLTAILSQLHAKELILGDIDTKNIWCIPEGKRYQLYYLGLSNIELTQAVQKQAGINAIVYTSPEMIDGDVVDKSSDLFSLGAVLYHLFAGHIPFSETEAHGMMIKITHQAHTTIHSIDKDFPITLDNIINRLLQKTPTKRFTTANQVLESLKRVEREVVSSQSTMRLRFPYSHIFRRVIPIIFISIAIISILAAYTVISVSRKSYLVQRHAVDIGISQTQLLARYFTEPIINQDWFGIKIGVEQIANNSNAYRRLLVIGYNGIVRGDNLGQLIDQSYKESDAFGNDENVLSMYLDEHSKPNDSEIQLLRIKAVTHSNSVLNQWISQQLSRFGLLIDFEYRYPIRLAVGGKQLGIVVVIPNQTKTHDILSESLYLELTLIFITLIVLSGVIYGQIRNTNSTR